MISSRPTKKAKTANAPVVEFVPPNVNDEVVTADSSDLDGDAEGEDIVVHQPGEPKVLPVNSSDTAASQVLATLTFSSWDVPLPVFDTSQNRKSWMWKYIFKLKFGVSDGSDKVRENLCILCLNQLIQANQHASTPQPLISWKSALAQTSNVCNAKRHLDSKHAQVLSDEFDSCLEQTVDTTQRSLDRSVTVESLITSKF